MDIARWCGMVFASDHLIGCGPFSFIYSYVLCACACASELCAETIKSIAYLYQFSKEQSKLLPQSAN